MWHHVRAMGRRWAYDTDSETGSESEISPTIIDAEYTGAMYHKGEGHGVSTGTIAQPFYQVNPARWNGADVEPVPITPVRGQNWPEMQIQLKNGWGQTSFGRRLSYDSYLRLLTDSQSKNRHYLIPNPAGIGPNAVNPGPAPSNVQKLIQGTSGAQPNYPGGPGFLAVNLTGRTYYG